MSFRALTPLLIEDGSLAEDLPKSPPRITSSGNFDCSEIQNQRRRLRAVHEFLKILKTKDGLTVNE